MENGKWKMENEGGREWKMEDGKWKRGSRSQYSVVSIQDLGRLFFSRPVVWRLLSCGPA
jgi:hypothetical protein